MQKFTQLEARHSISVERRLLKVKQKVLTTQAIGSERGENNATGL